MASEGLKRNGTREKRGLSTKLRKRIIRITAYTLTEAGWLSLMWNLWLSPNQVGTILSIMCIFAGDYLAIFED